MRPCQCDRLPAPGEELDITIHCRSCWKYHTDPKYKRLWDGPGLVEMAGNYLYSTAVWTAAGFPITAPEIAARRLETCEKCNRLELPTRKCLECGCPVDEKVNRATDGCPIGKWPGEIPKSGCCGKRATPPSPDIPIVPIPPPSS